MNISASHFLKLLPVNYGYPKTVIVTNKDRFIRLGYDWFETVL